MSHCCKSEHSHSYCGQTTFEDCHIHHFGGVTSKSDYDPCHTHTIEDCTTFKDGHKHHYKVKTGPAIPQPNGGHYHCFETRTSCEDDHIHYMKGNTSAD